MWPATFSLSYTPIDQHLCSLTEDYTPPFQVGGTYRPSYQGCRMTVDAPVEPGYLISDPTRKVDQPMA